MPLIQDQFLEDLTDEELRLLPFLFEFWAHPHQLPPEGDWHTWVVLGGRGAGKTRAGAEWVRSRIEGSRPTDKGVSSRVALVGETIDQAREVMVFGESGLLAASPPDRRPEWIAGRRMLVWPNGATAQIFSAFDPEALRGPQFDAVWADELGCPAVDKGTNEPNRFVDAKSSESGLPHYSDGHRDDLIQLRYLQAVLGHYADPASNPVSAVYGGPMVDLGRAHVWAWDARPYPFFPGLADVWADGPNHARGHWITGRSGARPLSSVVEEVCRASGLTGVETDSLHGLVQGYDAEGAGSGRAVLQPLMTAFGFDAVETGGVLSFRSRSDRIEATLAPEDMAVSDDLPAGIAETRGGAAEIAGRVRLTFIEAGGDLAPAATEAALDDEATRSIAARDLSLVLDRGAAGAVAERWLTEARVARTSARFILPPSRSELGAGDVVEIDGFGLYRIDTVDSAEAQEIEATRIEAGLYDKVPVPQSPPVLRPSTPVGPVEGHFLDLPLLRGDEVEHAPWFAATAEPWPGGVALHSSSQDAGYRLNTLIEQAALIGRTESVLRPAPTGLFDDGPALRVRLVSGTLASVSESDILGGSNLAAIGDGSTEGWELFQFADAVLAGDRTYDLSRRLRGQFGTEWAGATDHPVGAFVVFLGAGERQIDLAANARGLDRHYRFGPASKPLGDPSYRYRVERFRGAGLRPYAVCHLSAEDLGGDLAVAWIRRGRIDADSWEGPEIPLGEESELYRVQVWSAGSLLREETVPAPGWTYTAADQAADGAAPGYEIRVAQVSARFGPGPDRSIIPTP